VDSVHQVGPADTGWGEQWATTDSRYRWRLRRTWPATLDAGPARLMVFVGLNPSDATHTRDDNTLRRGVGYAHREGCAGVELVNLSPKRAHRPLVMLAELMSHQDDPPWADDNMRTILGACTGATDPGRPAPLVVLAWGAWAAHARLEPIAAQVRDRLALEDVTCWALGFTQDGEPKHPLYLRADAPLARVPATVAW